MTNIAHYFTKFGTGTLPTTRFQPTVQTEARVPQPHTYNRNPQCVTISWVLAHSLMSRLIIINQDLPCILQEVARFVVLQWHDNQPTYLGKSCIDNRKVCFRSARTKSFVCESKKILYYLLGFKEPALLSGRIEEEVVNSILLNRHRPLLAFTNTLDISRCRLKILCKLIKHCQLLHVNVCVDFRHE